MPLNEECIKCKEKGYSEKYGITLWKNGRCVCGEVLASVNKAAEKLAADVEKNWAEFIAGKSDYDFLPPQSKYNAHWDEYCRFHTAKLAIETLHGFDGRSHTGPIAKEYLTLFESGHNLLKMLKEYSDENT